MYIKIILKSGRCITKEMYQRVYLNDEEVKIVSYNGKSECFKLSDIQSIIGTQYIVYPYKLKPPIPVDWKRGLFLCCLSFFNTTGNS